MTNNKRNGLRFKMLVLVLDTAPPMSMVSIRVAALLYKEYKYRHEPLEPYRYYLRPCK